MTTIFTFAHFGLIIHHFLYIFRYLERLCLYNREISLAVLLRQNSKANMTKKCVFLNRKIYKKLKRDMIFLPYCPPLTGKVIIAAKLY